jgi:hypothetical protein
VRLVDERRGHRPARRRARPLIGAAQAASAAGAKPELGGDRPEELDDVRDVPRRGRGRGAPRPRTPPRGGRRPRTRASSASCAPTWARGPRARSAARARKRGRTRTARRRRRASSRAGSRATARGAPHARARHGSRPRGSPPRGGWAPPSCGCLSSVGWIS